MGYEGMEIADGETASIAFQQVTYGEVSEDIARKVQMNLEEYCRLDTEGMMWIVDRIRGL